jgi:hypothetical protein
MLVYRIEHPSNGQGPYDSNMYEQPTNYWRMLEKHDLSDKHPSPRGEFGPKAVDKDLYCALHSEERIKEWFHGFRGLLRNNGFKLMVFECEPVFYSEESGQILFKRLECEPIKIKNIP